MTTRERFLRCMRFEPVDRPPNFELGYWGQTVDRWLAEGMPESALAPDPLHGHGFFGIDRRDYVPIHFGPVPAFATEVLEETDREILYRDGDGILRRALKEGTVRGTRPSMDQYLAFPVRTREDLQQIKKRYDPASPGRLPADWPRFCPPVEQRTAPLCLVPNGAFGFYSHARRWMGTEGLSLAFYEDPALVEEMMEFLGDFFLATVRPVLEEGQVDYFNFFEDFAYKTAPLLSPALFRRFLEPQYRRVLDALRRHGVEIIWFDSDGNVEPLLPLLIEIGITCLWPMEIAADMDPRRIRQEYRHDLALSGGIDKREIARDKAAIEREVYARIPELVADGGYVPTLDHAVPPDISYDNFRYYLEVKDRAMTRG